MIETVAGDALRTEKGPSWRVVGSELVEHAVYQSLSPTQQQLLIHLDVICHPSWGKQLSAKDMAGRTGRNERTCRKNARVLEELGLIEIERQGGGSHNAKNRYFVCHRDAKGRIQLPSSISPRVPGTGKPPRVAPAAAPDPLRPPTPAPALRDPRLTDQVLEQLGYPAADIDAYLAADPERGPRLVREAEREGLIAPATPAAPATATREDAERVVREWCAVWRIGRDPLTSEVNLARSLLQHSGSDAWPFIVAAQQRLVDQRNRGRGQVPWSMLYLVPHLEAVGARFRRPEPRTQDKAAEG